MDLAQYQGLSNAVKVSSTLQQLEDRSSGKIVGRMNSHGTIMGRFASLSGYGNSYSKNIFVNPGVMRIIPNNLTIGTLVSVGNGVGSRYGIVSGNSKKFAIKPIAIGDAREYIKNNPKVDRYELDERDVGAILLASQGNSLVEKWVSRGDKLIKVVVINLPLMMLFGVIVGLGWIIWATW